MGGLLGDWLTQMRADGQFEHGIDIGTTYSFFILHITMRCMVETQYDAAGCLSTASLLHTTYFILHTSYFILHTSYFKRKPLQVVAVWLGGVRGEKGMYEEVGASALGR